MSDFQRDGDSASPYSPASGDMWRDEIREPPAAHETTSPTPFNLRHLADSLPKLGAVLWLDRRAWRARPSRATISARGVLLLDHPALAVLSRCCAVTAHTAITPQGPREWLCFRDAAGDAQGKLFLLPDTDYLAWDEMAAASRIAPPSTPPRRQAHNAFLRGALTRLGGGWRARLLMFDLKRLPWLRTLGARPPLRISLLGLELARVIARAEGAELISPLHTA
ncbi:hypothetical protein [Dokdonella soli]|uniref:Hemin transport protein n=1 Tax=Dokdonella soli TaxID=529810 RepID=A0ABP3TP27_9GAMM